MLVPRKGRMGGAGWRKGRWGGAEGDGVGSRVSGMAGGLGDGDEV